VADKPDGPLVERTELVDLDEEASAPELPDDRTDAPAEPDRLDRCVPEIPLVEETVSVAKVAIVLLDDVRPTSKEDWNWRRLATWNSGARCPRAFADLSEIQEMLLVRRDTD
jgi:hypothetical protein